VTVLEAVTEWPLCQGENFSTRLKADTELLHRTIRSHLRVEMLDTYVFKTLNEARHLEEFSGSLWFTRCNVRYDALISNIAHMVR